MKLNNFLKFFTVVFLFVGAVTISAQTVKGKVTDSSGEALSFMNVVEKGTTNGTTSDFDGNYTINVENDTKLVFSYIGFASQEVSTAGKSVINVQLS